MFSLNTMIIILYKGVNFHTPDVLARAIQHEVIATELKSRDTFLEDECTYVNCTARV